MIKQGIKNYIKNLKYVFTPLGVIALGIAFGLSVLIPGTIYAVQNLAERIAEISGNATVDFEALKNCIAEAAGGLNWNDPWSAVGTMFSGDWLFETFNKGINALLPNSDIYAAEITETINNSVHLIGASVVVFIVWLFLGFIGGFFLTKFLVRRTMAKRVWWKFFLAAIVDWLLTFVILFLLVWLQSLWQFSAIFVSVFALILTEFASLTEAYFIHGFKKVEFKNIVNIQNVGMLWLTDLIIFVITVALVLIFFSLTNVLVGIFMAIPLIEIAFMVNNLNAEAYVKEMTEN